MALGPYEIIADIERVYVNLKRVTGETLQALPGEIVLLADDCEEVVKHFIEQGVLKKTSSKPSPWPRVAPVEVDEEQVAAVQAVVKAAAAEDAKSTN